ncbi:unnamed protein product [marine sediment metagenome]|uniref:Uncharacterized protein n=1 Tax=marine sediment metagenome TaxID=412755 RepID=X1ABD0_9ZZZZ
MVKNKMENKSESLWDYLNTSQGTHKEMRVAYGSDGHSFNDPVESVSVSNKTPLEKIIRTGIVIGIIVGGGLYIRSCIQDQKKTMQFIY